MEGMRDKTQQESAEVLILCKYIDVFNHKKIIIDFLESIDVDFC